MEAKLIAVVRAVLLSVAVASALGAWSEARSQTVLFSTGFEAAEGYRTDGDLTGQKGWIGSGADGILTNFFGDADQQAYIGFEAPSGDTNNFHYVYRPINLAPIPTNQALVKFSVLLQIVDSSSTNGPFDSFRWSVYNTNATRLFSLEFDNDSLEIFYLLDDGGGFVPTDRSFDTFGQYQLEISMNFARNLWTAILNDEVIVNSKPITTIGSALNLGDIDAVWSLFDAARPGDNYMVFDDYVITAEPVTSIAPRLESLGRSADGVYHARLYGESGLVYRIETSTNLREWTPLLTLTAPIGGILDFQDSTASTVPQRFFRARQGP